MFLASRGTDSAQSLREETHNLPGNDLALCLKKPETATDNEHGSPTLPDPRDETWDQETKGGSMFHTKFKHGAECRAILSGEVALRNFFSGHDEALGHAAALLAGRRGVRLVNAIGDGLDQPGRITRRVQRLLLELRRILFLDHEHDDDWDDTGIIAMMEPDDPIVPEICLLADGLDEALHAAGIVGSADVRAA